MPYPHIRRPPRPFPLSQLSSRAQTNPAGFALIHRGGRNQGMSPSPWPKSMPPVDSHTVARLSLAIPCRLKVPDALPLSAILAKRENGSPPWPTCLPRRAVGRAPLAAMHGKKTSVEFAFVSAMCRARESRSARLCTMMTNSGDVSSVARIAPPPGRRRVREESLQPLDLCERLGLGLAYPSGSLKSAHWFVIGWIGLSGVVDNVRVVDLWFEGYARVTVHYGPRSIPGLRYLIGRSRVNRTPSRLQLFKRVHALL
jgi:hypothetical protein